MLKRAIRSIALDCSQAEKFLNALGIEKATFLVFSESGQGGKFWNRRGRLSDLWQQIQAHHTPGTAVNWMVNDGDSGIADKNITRIRAVFMDLDRPDDTRLERLRDTVFRVLPPTAVIESSPGKHHLYWKVSGDFPVAAFRQIQERLCHWLADEGADPGVKSLSRKKRLPGTLHWKSGDTHLCHLVETRPVSYSLEDLVKAIPELPLPEEGGRVIAYGKASLAGALRDLVAADVGQRNRTLYQKARKLFSLVDQDFGLDAGQVERELAAAAGCIGLDATEIRHTLNSARDAAIKKPDPAPEILAGHDKRTPIIDMPQEPETFAVDGSEAFLKIPDSCKKFFVVRHGMAVAEEAQFPAFSAVVAGLTAYSALFSVAFRTEFPNGSPIALGLYTAVEQPSGAAKSRVLGGFYDPIREAFRAENRRTRKDLQDKESPLLPIPKSNATPEALEDSCTGGNSGSFIVASSEQAGLRSLFGDAVVNRPVSNEILLEGWQGGFVSTERVTRQGLDRRAWGSICFVAQAGSIDAILRNDKGQGLMARFLPIAEGHLVGQRDFSSERPVPPEIKGGFKGLITATLNCYDALGEKGFLEPLFSVKPGPGVEDAIRGKRQELEPRLGELVGDNGSSVLAELVSKFDIHARKVAAILYLGELLQDGRPMAEGDLVFGLEHWQAGEDLVGVVVNHVERTLTDKDMLGLGAARKAVYGAFKKHRVRKERELKQHLKAYPPFKGQAQTAKAISRVLSDMLRSGDLHFDVLKKEYSLT